MIYVHVRCTTLRFVVVALFPTLFTFPFTLLRLRIYVDLRCCVVTLRCYVLLLLLLRCFVVALILGVVVVTLFTLRFVVVEFC